MEIEIGGRYLYVSDGDVHSGEVVTIKGRQPDDSGGGRWYICELSDGSRMPVMGEELKPLPSPVLTDRQLFKAFCKQAGLWVWQAEDGYHDWLIVSQRPFHRQLVHARFIADTGAFDYFSIEYDDPDRRICTYEEARPNILK